MCFEKGTCVCIWPISCTSCPGSLKGVMGRMCSYTMPLIFTSISFIGLLQHVYITAVKKQKGKERANCPVAPCEISFRDSLGLKPRIWKTTLPVWHRVCTGGIIGFSFCTGSAAGFVRRNRRMGNLSRCAAKTANSREMQCLSLVKHPNLLFAWTLWPRFANGEQTKWSALFVFCPADWCKEMQLDWEGSAAFSGGSREQLSYKNISTGEQTLVPPSCVTQERAL